jgi:hypothetical protein
VGHVAFAWNAVLTLFVAAHAGIQFLFPLKYSRIFQTTHPFFFGLLPLFFGVHALQFFFFFFFFEFFHFSLEFTH